MKRKNKRFAAILFCLIGALIAALLWGLYRQVHPPKIQTDIDPNQPMIALTFDDGPNARYTPPILDLLYRYQAPSTFFVVGEHLKGNHLLVQEMVSSGHQLGNHTYSHLDLTTLTPAEITQQVEKNQQTLWDILPDYTMQCVRPPYGHTNELVQSTVSQPIILWDIDSNDWEVSTPQEICDKILPTVKDGDIIIFHDDNETTVQALEQLLPALKQKGFQFVTIQQLQTYR